MRFEVGAAFAIGIILPLLETCRRGMGEWSVDFTTMFIDYLAGARGEVSIVRCQCRIFGSVVQERM